MILKSDEILYFQMATTHSDPDHTHRYIVTLMLLLVIIRCLVCGVRGQTLHLPKSLSGG